MYLMYACGCGQGTWFGRFLLGLWQGFTVVYRLIANLACKTYYIHGDFHASTAYTVGYIAGVALFFFFITWLVGELLGRRLVFLAAIVAFVLIAWSFTR